VNWRESTDPEAIIEAVGRDSGALRDVVIARTTDLEVGLHRFRLSAAETDHPARLAQMLAHLNEARRSIRELAREP
jgi:hypothetical protein